MELPGTVWLALFLLVTFITVEVLNPEIINEGFNLIGVSDDKNNFFSNFALRRGDVSINKEEKNFIQDPRYYMGYVDVQNFGLKNDFCRMVIPEQLDSSLEKSQLQKVDSDKKKFGDLYKNTIEREILIKNNGYNLITIWENDYYKNKKT